MKKYIIYTVILLLMFTISCNKEKIEIDEYWGEAGAIKNGNNWTCLPHAGISNISDKLFISCNTYSKEGYHREQLLLFKIPLNKGEYNVERTGLRDEDDKTGAKFFTSVDDGDVTGDIYYIAESDSLSIVSITKIEGKEIWGTFNLTLFRDTTRVTQHPDVSDTLIFTNGEFHTKILVE